MLVSFNDLRRSKITAVDGDVGSPTDLLFRDDAWRVVYAVADVGSFLTSREILLETDMLGRPDMSAMVIPTQLTTDSISAAPELQTDPPVSAQHRDPMLPSYFLMPPDGAYSPYLTEMFLAEETRRRDEAGEEAGDPHLRSMAEGLGYAISATDGRIGTVEDFLIDPETWRIAYLAVDTGDWLPGRKVVLGVDWIDGISYHDRAASVPFESERVENAPEPSSLTDLQRADLEPLHNYYGYPMV